MAWWSNASNCRTDPHRILLISDNAHHKSYEMTIEEAQIIGRVSAVLSVM